MVVALRRKHPYDVFWMHGHADTIARRCVDARYSSGHDPPPWPDGQAGAPPKASAAWEHYWSPAIW
jgi:hypothetical protein